MFPNLTNEMNRKGITYKAVAAVIGVNEKSVWNKMNGVSDFTLSEVLAINENLFPEFELRYLFKREAKAGA